MASPERKISAVPSGAANRPSALDARLASLEDEATRLRAEVAALQDDLRWLAGEDEEASGWLARGWVRASLLLATVGMVALVSLPYLLHLDASAPDPVKPASAGPARVAEPARVAPAVIKAGAREHSPAPVRVRSAAAPEPARIRSAAPEGDAVPVVAPIRAESP
ncbi:MAG: hypothetical protein ACREK9_19650 [Candidatus Rokuibacteriota bacterium]